MDPGDLRIQLWLGTPARCGVGLDPPRYLGLPDVIRTAITDLGFMENAIHDEVAAAASAGRP